MRRKIKSLLALVTLLTLLVTVRADVTPGLGPDRAEAAKGYEQAEVVFLKDLEELEAAL